MSPSKLENFITHLGDIWFLVVAIVGNIVYTRVIQAKHHAAIEDLRRQQERDRAQRKEDLERLDRRFDDIRVDIREISSDIKQLLQRHDN